MSESSVQSPLRLLVVDDHEVVRQGLAALLDRRESFQVVAEAGTVADSIEQARRKTEAWRIDYNEHRPHGALGHLTPSEYAKAGQKRAFEAADF